MEHDNYVHNKSNNLTFTKDDLYSQILNNIYFRIFVIILIFIFILQIILLIRYIFIKYRKIIYLFSPQSRIDRKKGIVIELGSLNHSIKN